MTKHTEAKSKPAAAPLLPPLLLDLPADDWRLSRPAKPLRTWRLSK
ncbi:hypothetical protein [Pseudomonas cavernae]|nr:hypothetical protein [Pseudomonas cavernae]